MKCPQKLPLIPPTLKFLISHRFSIVLALCLIKILHNLINEVFTDNRSKYLESCVQKYSQIHCGACPIFETHSHFNLFVPK